MQKCAPKYFVTTNISFKTGVLCLFSVYSGSIKYLTDSFPVKKDTHDFCAQIWT